MKKTAKFDPTYAASIHAHKRELEKKYIISKPFLGPSGMQSEINANMRITLLDWLVKLADDMNLSCGTYALTIHLIDLALSKVSVKRSQFQLLGCACILIASKLEELQPPLVADLVYRSDYCFDNEELINYEQRMMGVFDLRPNLPTRYSFTQRYCLAGGCSAKEESMAVFLTELSLYKVEFSLLSMSCVAAAAVHLALQILRPRGTYKEEEAEQKRRSDLGDGEEESERDEVLSSRPASRRYIWTKSLEYYTGYQEWELVDTVLKLREAHFHLEDTTLTQGIMARYNRERHHSVSHIGALRVQDVRWDTQKAWANCKQHPLSYGYHAAGPNRAGDVVVGEAQNSQGSGHGGDGGIGTSTSTCNIQSHPPPALAPTVQQQQQQQGGASTQSSVTYSVSNRKDDGVELAARANTGPTQGGGAVEIAQPLPLRVTAPMSRGGVGAQKEIARQQKQKQRRLQQSTLAGLPPKAATGNKTTATATRGEVVRTGMNPLRSLASANVKGMSGKRSNVGIARPVAGAASGADKAQPASRPSSAASYTSTTSLAHGGGGGSSSSTQVQAEEAPAYTSTHARCEGVSRASRGAGQAQSTLHDIMRGGSGGAETSTSSASSSSGASNGGESLHLLNVSRNSAFSSAAGSAMRRPAGLAGDTSSKTSVSGKASSNIASGQAPPLPHPKRRRLGQTALSNSDLMPARGNSTRQWVGKESSLA